MGPISAWAALLVGCLAYCGTMVLHAFLFGNRLGSSETELKNLKEEHRELKALVGRIRSAFERSTGISVDGFETFVRKGGD
jgi:hypothetical protein